MFHMYVLTLAGIHLATSKVEWTAIFFFFSLIPFFLLAVLIHVIVFTNFVLSVDIRFASSCVLQISFMTGNIFCFDINKTT